MRARQLGITLGLGMPGELNAITDVPGVRVGHATLKAQVDGKQVRTGVTLIQPRAGEARHQPCFAGYHVLNGNGDATGPCVKGILPCHWSVSVSAPWWPS